MVTHPGTNRARRRVTTLIESNNQRVTTMPHHHLGIWLGSSCEKFSLQGASYMKIFQKLLGATFLNHAVHEIDAAECVITEHCEGRIPWTSSTVHGEGTAWRLEADTAWRTHRRHRWCSSTYLHHIRIYGAAVVPDSGVGTPGNASHSFSMNSCLLSFIRFCHTSVDVTTLTRL